MAWQPTIAGNSEPDSPAILSRRIRRVLTLAGPRVLDEVLVLARLRAPILLGRSNVSAQLRGCMPRQARVVKHGLGQRDRVGVMVGDDGLGRFRLGNQADRYRRKA